MRRETKAERKAWTEHFGMATETTSKYSNERKGKYASKHEESVAVNLHALAKAGDIWDLQEQVRFQLVPGNGKIRPIVYIADFTYKDEEGYHVLDAKGYKTPIYRLKKKLAALLIGIDIEEV